MNEIRPSHFLGMTLPMFDMLSVQGVQNAKILTKIAENLSTLYEALKRIEAEANGEQLEKDDKRNNTEMVGEKKEYENNNKQRKNI